MSYKLHFVKPPRPSGTPPLKRRGILLFCFSAFLLSPFSLIFGLIGVLRRKFIRSKSVAVPTICVGNLRVGGTGKTPHVEYIAKLLSQNHQVAILSRGYGRKTKGYINAHECQNLNNNKQIPNNLISKTNLSNITIGDEPMQYATKFPNIEVAVCEKRETGIEKLLQKNPKLEVVVLDDAYQYLSVNYSLRILLTEYQRPFFKDYPLPSGRLREFRCAAKYADIIIVTKCPNILTTEEKTYFLQKLKPKSYQDVYFTKIEYAECPKSPSKFEGVPEGRGSLYQSSKFNDSADSSTEAEPQPSGCQSFSPSVLQSFNQKVLLITGIDNPDPLVQHLKKQCEEIHCLHFPDHHSFTNKDIEKIVRLKNELGGENCTIITTEKDAMRLQPFENMPEYSIIPIEIAFLENEADFNEKLLSLLNHK